MSGADRERTRWFLRNILPHESALRGWLSRRPLPGVDVDDVIQEAYSILAELETVEGIRYPRAYLFQVARSVITRHVRRARIVPIHTVDDLERLEHSDDAPSPEQHTIDRDELRQLARAIAAMPLKTREAFILRRVKDLPQREIAARMRISENTVETHISRGVLFLIDWFGRGGNKRSQTSKTLEAEIAGIDGRARHQSRH
ncbi:MULTISPECIES: RNA polymerase sigma factor [unclassified Caulobacter]|jgi:RNA polymerase sigma-70 factor (ECF subfamily)|uniref:RNA polymerase sigma factor n=1 Tax=unclassified Caulobacter TaxID=2648921 RepID=UPI0006FA5082|nr:MULTISPECIES: sigma-70 family RNA polymerase sigma factor [unclassified Caulobacter]KQV55651.1 RNA polymerase subunit sigma-24 [Caulobacter sp. Root342]KQV71177.1 RNA polymerase subunit sigma-24 [Caulobacter sp. Root343]